MRLVFYLEGNMKLGEYAMGKTIDSTVSRRQFGAAAGVAAITAGTPGLAIAQDALKGAQITESTVSLPTANGTVRGFFAHPAKGQHPGVLAWRNGADLGVSSRNEARRLAGQGYSVLVLDRDGADAMRAEAETLDVVAWLEENTAVNAERGVGTPQWAKDRLKPARRV